MSDRSSQTDASSIDSLTHPETLGDRDDVAFEEVTREFDEGKFEALRERYDAIDGVVQVGITTSDGRLLVQGPPPYAPPGGNVQPDEDWVDAARRNMETMTGVDVEVDDVKLVSHYTFQHADDPEQTFTSYTATFRASLADEDGEFAANPTVADGLDLPENYELEFEWVEGVPENAHDNHVEHIELFFE